MIKKIRSLTNLISILLLFSISFGYDFPIIDDFEDGDYTLSTAWTFEAALNTSIINNASGARGHYSTRITGTTSGYWVGAGRADLTPFLDDWTEYKYFSIWVNNRGEIGDKLQIRIIDNDNDANNPWDDDQFVYEIPIYKQNVWVEVIIPYTLFIDDIIWNSDGDGIFNLDPYEGKAGVSAVKVGFNSITTAGAIAMDIDEISLRDTTNGVDSDADGLPDDWENIYELDPNNANGSNGGNGDPDGDGITNLAEYINETVPKNIFPVIDNFEDADPTSLPTWDINDNISLSTINAGSDGNYSVQIIGTAFGNYAGYLSAYIGDKDTDWSGYNFVHLVLNNMGQAGDKLKIEIFDNDNDNYDIDSGSWLSGDDKFAYEFSLNKKDQWQDIYIPYSVFTDINANTGNNTFDIAPANNFPGVLMIGLAFNSATDSGAITINIDKISLAATINETDSDNDGLPDDWEQQYGLNASSANGDDGPTGNPDGDAYTNLEEYINGTVPKSTATISSKYYINEGADGWGNGSWGAGSVAASYQISNNYYHQLEINDNSFSAKNGMWIGITSNSDQPVVDLGNYKKIVFDLRSDNGELFIYLKDKNDNVSSKYKYLNINAGEFTSFEISMNYFQTGSFDISGVREILFEPAEISLVPQTINIRNIYFDEGDLSTGVLNTPIVDELILRNFLSGDPYSPLTSTTDYKEASKHLWNSYKARFIDSYKSIVTQGLNLEGLVFDPYVGSSTTKIEAGDYAKSEGSGYAMLLAVYMNDQAAFDEIFDGTWASQMHKSTSSNLFAWNINTDGTFVNNDKNSASDADQDIAFSLILADTLVQSEIWSNTSREYDKKAQSLINALYEYTISKNKYLMPSDEAGRLGFNEVDNPTNPSYFSPAWYRIFDMYENNDHDWGAIIDWGYALVVSADPNGIGLNPDWCDYWGNDKETANFYHYMTGKDAVRVQWRLATDWLWFGETKAQTYLEKTKSVFSYPGSIGPGSIAPINVKPLELNGAYSYETRGDGYNYTDVSLVSMFAAGAMGSNNDNYRKEWKGAFDNYMYLAQNGLNSFLGEKLNGAEAKIDFDSQMNYYNHCLGILSALMVSGAFPNVYSATNMPTNNLLSPVIDSFEDGNLTNTQNWTAANNIDISIVNQSQNDTYSIRGTGQAGQSGPSSNYYVGYSSAYLGNTILDWSNYKYLKLIIKNDGQVGDKIKIEIIDNDTLTYSVLEAAGTGGDDKFAYEFSMLWTGTWKEIYIPYSMFTDVNPNTGNNTFDLKPQTDYPGTLLLGFAYNSIEKTGRVTVDIDDISISQATNVTDADEDGMDDSWESSNGLNSSNGTDGATDADADGYSNFEEYINGTNPQVKNIFPVVDNFENTGLVWSAADGLLVVTESFAEPSILNAMKMTGTAVTYNSGFNGAYIGSSLNDWDKYSSIKFMIRNDGQVGDKIKIQLTDNDNDDYAGENGTDDVWAFEQVINTTATWSYYTIPFSYFIDTNPLSGNDTLDLSPSGNYPGAVYLGIVNLSKTATGNTEIYIDNIEVSTTPTSDDNDGDGLPNYWEEQYSLSTNSAASLNGTNGDPDADGYDNFTEYLNGTNPIVANVFPIVENYDDGDFTAGPEWTATDNLSLVMDSGAMKMSGTATNYYTGFAGAYIADPYADWDSYSAIKFRLKNNGQVGDKIKIQLTDDDNGNGTIEEADDDVWAFEQVINTTGNWVYFNLPFSLFADMNTANVDTALNFEKTGNNPGVLYIGIANNSVVTEGSTEILIDDIEVSNVPTTNDNDGDGLPNDWETQYGLSTNSSVSNNGTSGDPDGDGYSNLVEYTNNTDPTQKEWFPIIDNYDDGNINLNPVWNANDGLVLTMDSGAMKMSGSATDYYTGFAGASIASPYADWSTYSSIKFKLKNNGVVGDKIKIQLTDNDNVGGIEANDDEWAFEQVINTTATWSYYTVLFSSMEDMNPATGNSTIDFGKTGNEPGILYIGIANNSKTATGSTDIYIDNIEVSTTPTSNDNDGDGLPNYWEEQHSLSANSAVSPNGTNSDPDGDGYDNFTEYLNHSNPMSAEKFPVIDDFEGISNLSETSWNVNELTTKEIVSNTLHLSGTASNYYAGYLSNYVGNYIFDWSSYSYLKIDIKNNGQIGDKIAVTIVDNDKAGYDVDYDADDTYQVKIIFSDTGVSNSYYIPLPSMRDLDVSSGDNVQNFTPIDPEYPGVSFIGFAFNSTSSSGVVDVNIDKIELTTTIYYTADSDGDSLLDVWEKLYSFNENSSTGYDGAAGDPDGDGMPNLIEQNNMTDPSFGNSQMIDSDSDGMPNNWETRFGLIPSINDAAGDSDGDTLSNYVEYLLGSSPLTSNADTSFYPDTDTDGLPDYWEIAYGLSPTVSNAVSDTDSDGKTDLQEYQLGTNPNDQRISLSTGWNLISIGISGNNVSEVVASINVQNGGGINISQVYYMDNATKAWKSYDAEASSGDDPVLSYGEAIFVNSKSNLTYLPAGNRVSSHTYEFYNGWNAMGKDIGSAYTAKEMSDEIKNAGGDILRIYKLENGSWKYYNAETGAGENFTITKYKGLYISFGSNYTWTPLK